MPFAPVNGINIYYESHGKGPHVLFAHGQGGNHLSWWRQVPFFAKHYTCITFDHRAFGFSHDSDNRGRFSFGADVIGLLDHLGIDDVRVVAHSMGGRSALPLALRSTERMRAVVFGGTNGGVSDDAVARGQQEAAEARGGRGLGAFSVAGGFREENPAMYFLLREISRMNPPRAADFLRQQSPDPLTRPRGNVVERLIATKLPVLFIVGEHDQITPPSLIEQCHRLIPGSRYHMVQGSGHSAYFERPDEYNRVVLDFLKSVDEGTFGVK
jgi:pimeloyl-ACP methyl ester carboxylesterase